MLHRFSVLNFSAAATLLAALFVASSAPGAAYDGPGKGCVTHVGWTWVDLSTEWVHSEGSGGCNSTADSRYTHDVRFDIEHARWYGWIGIATNSRTGFHAPFSVWLPIDRGPICPGQYRGHVVHVSKGVWLGEDNGTNSRYTNSAGC